MPECKQSNCTNEVQITPGRRPKEFCSVECRTKFHNSKKAKGTGKGRPKGSKNKVKEVKIEGFEMTTHSYPNTEIKPQSEWGKEMNVIATDFTPYHNDEDNKKAIVLVKGSNDIDAKTGDPIVIYHSNRDENIDVNEVIQKTAELFNVPVYKEEERHNTIGKLEDYLPSKPGSYDGIEVNKNYFDEKTGESIIEKITPYVRQAQEAYFKLNQLGGEKALTNAAVKSIKKKVADEEKEWKPKLSPFMLERQKKKGGSK